MYTIVTGAAGFIGANIVKALNERGETDIIAVDNLTRADKFRNLVDCEIADYLDKEDFIERLLTGCFDGDVAAIFHQGACSDTMETDGHYMMENNYRYSVGMLDWCLEQGVQFLYASSAATYGGGDRFVESRECEAPLNVYGYSKFLFDQIVRQRLAAAGPQLLPAERLVRGAGPLWLIVDNGASAAPDWPQRLARHQPDPQRVFAAWRDTWRSPEFRAWNIEPEVAQIRAPALAIQGCDDEYGTLAQIRGIAQRVPGTRLLELPDCAHSPHRDQPDAVVAAAVAFIQAHHTPA